MTFLLIVKESYGMSIDLRYIDRDVLSSGKWQEEASDEG